jgi:hypothetical protein
VPRERAPAGRRGASEVRRATSLAMLLGTAGAAQRAATPARWALEARGVPLSGRCDGLGGVDRRQQCRALPPQGGAAASEGPGRPPRRGSARGLGEPAPTAAHRPLGRIARVVCGLAPMHRLPVEGLAAHQGQAFVGLPSREPVPGPQTRDGHDEARAIGGKGLEHRGRGSWHVAGQEDCSSGSSEADVQAPRVQLTTPGQGVLVGGESP